MARNSRQPLEKIGWSLIFVVVFAFYCWTATSSRNPFQWRTEKRDHYNLLADAFLSGQLHLRVAPAPGLLALKDPYDPAANLGYRLHDASLYKGKYYLYFGPVPVLALFLPWKLITGWGIPANFAVVLYLAAGYIFSCLLLFLLLRACDVRTPWFLKGTAVAGLGLCQAAPIILRRPLIYEVAIAAGFCFYMGGMYFLARRIVTEERRPWLAVLAGLFFGLTAGCRPHFAFVAALVGVIYLGYLARSRRLAGKALLREVFCFGAPIAICGVLLAWYNFTRFGNPLEFGVRYQLTFFPIRISIHLRNLVPGLYYFLLTTPRSSHDFPFLKLVGRAPFGQWGWLPENYSTDRMAGLIPISPLCLAACVLPLFLRWGKKWIDSRVRLVLSSLYLSAMAALVAVCLINGAAMRYEVDFAPALLLISLFACLLLTARAASSRIRGGISVLMIIGCIWSAGTNAALSINSYDNSLMYQNPRTFHALASFFGQNDESIPLPVRELKLQADVVFPRQAPGRREALLTTGSTEDGDFLFVEYAGNDRIKCAYYKWGMGGRSGPELSVTPGGVYPLTIRYTAATGRLGVWLGDVIALDLLTVLYPTSPNEVTLGDDPIGAPLSLQPFSGSLRVPQDGFLLVSEM